MFNRFFLLLFCFLLILPTGACAIRAADTPIAEKAVEVTSFVDSLTFLGDSTTAHMAQRSPIVSERIWAAKNRYLNLDSRITYAKIVAPDTGKEEEIASVAARIRPERLVITLGVDYGVYYYRDQPETFAFYYEKLLDLLTKAAPDTELILQSIFPVGRESVAITPQMVNVANLEIKKIADKRGLLYVDQTSVLADDEGFLKNEYCYSSDGLHLTKGAYLAILEHLESVGAGEVI